MDSVFRREVHAYSNVLAIDYDDVSEQVRRVLVLAPLVAQAVFSSMSRCRTMI